MKLYYSPGASSLAPHIAFREARIDMELVGVDLRNKMTSQGRDFTDLNPFGYVPLLELDDGATLREVTAILLYIADQAPEVALAPAQGTPDRLRLVEWLNFLSSELHQGLALLARTGPSFQFDHVRAKLFKQFAWIDMQLSAKPYLSGSHYSVADIYLWVLSNWARADWIDSVFNLDINLTDFANIQRWHKNIAGREAARSALIYEWQPSHLDS